MKSGCFRILAAAVAAVALHGLVAAQGSAPVVSVTVSGANVAVSWTAVAGAASYRVDVGTYPGGGTNILSANVGAVVSAGGALPVGTYYNRVFPVIGGAIGTGSIEVVFNVGTPRGTPGGFTAAIRRFPRVHVDRPVR